MKRIIHFDINPQSNRQGLFTVTTARRAIVKAVDAPPSTAKNIITELEPSNIVSALGLFATSDEVVVSCTQSTARRHQLLAFDHDLALTKKALITNGSNNTYGIGQIVKDGSDYYCAGETYLSSRFSTTLFKTDISFDVSVTDQDAWDWPTGDSNTKFCHIVKTSGGIYAADYALISSVVIANIRHYDNSFTLLNTQQVDDWLYPSDHSLYGIAEDSAGRIIVVYGRQSDIRVCIARYDSSLTPIDKYVIPSGRNSFRGRAVYVSGGNIYINCAMRSITEDRYDACVIKVAEDMSSYKLVTPLTAGSNDSGRFSFGGGVKSNGNVIWAGTRNLTGAPRTALLEFDSDLNIVRQIIADGAEASGAAAVNGNSSFVVLVENKTYGEVYRFDEPDFPTSTTPSCGGANSWINTTETFETQTGTPTVQSISSDTISSSGVSVTMADTSSAQTTTANCEF